MTFLYPMMLWALALPLLLAVLAFLRHRHQSRGWRLLVSPAHEATLVVKTPVWRRTLPLLALLLALTCGILAAARPINGYTNSEALASGRNLLIALDISRSMETRDVKPSRLEEARAAAFELVHALPGDKIGLIVFSGEADLVVPLTYDHTALCDALEQVNRDWAGYGGTNFGAVLRKAMQDFARSAPTGTNALVIFSDGEDTVGSTAEMAREAKEKNLLVITVGVGTSVGDSIPDARGENGLYQDASGKHVISKLDAAALQRFSEATGGDFFTMGSGADLAAFARQAVAKLDRHEESYAGHKVPRDLFAPFAIAALLLLLAAILLGTEWKPRSRSLPMLFMLLLLFAGAGPLSAAPEADSCRAYEDALGQMSADADKARELFSRALLDEDADMQAACLYELGNIGTRGIFGKLRQLYGQEQPQASAGEEEDAEETDAASAKPAQPSPEQLQTIVEELEASLTPYRDALSIRPSLQAAQVNISRIEEFIQKLKEEIERLKQQQQQENQQQNDQEQQSQDDHGQQQPDDADKQENEGEDAPQKPQSPQNGEEPEQGDQKQPEDQQPEQDGEQPQGNPEEQKPQDEPQQPQQPQEQPGTPPPPAEQPTSDKEKAEQRAASILNMHLDEEGGSPIPRANPHHAVRPAEKDY